jgi:hypothetical protein
MPLLALLAVLLFATRADAYIDPGAGSLLTQLLFGGLAGLVVVVKLYWRRLLAWIGVAKAAPESTPEPPRT